MAESYMDQPLSQIHLQTFWYHSWWQQLYTAATIIPGLLLTSGNTELPLISGLWPMCLIQMVCVCFSSDTRVSHSQFTFIWGYTYGWNLGSLWHEDGIKKYYALIRLFTVLLLHLVLCFLVWHMETHNLITAQHDPTYSRRGGRRFIQECHSHGVTCNAQSHDP